LVCRESSAPDFSGGQFFSSHGAPPVLAGEVGKNGSFHGVFGV
jgi:hypothetical protein